MELDVQALPRRRGAVSCQAGFASSAGGDRFSPMKETAVSATLVFRTANDFYQGYAPPLDLLGNKLIGQGICTAASMNWAKKVLTSGRSIDSFEAIGLNVHTLNAQMAKLRKLDDDPEEQCDLVGLQMVGNIGNKDLKIASIADVIKLGEDNPSEVIIFWTKVHTMAYRYASKNKEFFDIEVGLYRATTTADIKKKMEEITGKPGYGKLVGARVVKLKD
jgi:hypothetical protein